MKKLAAIGAGLILFQIYLSAVGFAQLKKRTTARDTERATAKDLSSLSTFANEILSESFEDALFPPEGWKKITVEGFAPDPGWQRLEVGENVTGFEDDSGAPIAFDFPPPGGGDAVAHCSWQTGDPDGNFETPEPTEQWLITPQLSGIQTGDTLKFVLQFFEANIDTVDILLSTEGDSIPDFTTAIDTITNSGIPGWVEYAYPLTDFAAAGADVFIAFREHVSNTSEAVGDAVFLDLVRVIRDNPTIVDEEPTLPSRYALQQNYPNPFNPSTSIRFSLPRRSVVSLEVYDLLGKSVATLIDKQAYAAGEHAVQFKARDLPTGIYFYQLRAGSFVQTRKLTIIK